MKCNETLSKWCKNKHGASKIIDTLETYQGSQLDGKKPLTPFRIKHNFLAPLPGKKKTSARGVSHAHPLLCFSFALFYFYLHHFIKNTQKN
jgi:hypothetical protein